MKQPTLFTRLLPALALALLVLAPLAQAQVVGTVTKVSGLMVAKSAEGRSRVLAENSPLRQGDTITTGRNTFGRLEFVDGAAMVLQPETLLVLTRYRYDAGKPELDKVELELTQGGFTSTTGTLGKRSPDATVITTPAGNLQGGASMEVSLR
ncbi:hypothetical protein ACEN8I_14940 [Polaromonas sp. CT11-55]|uniref:hypothetical protein n=1 Tax=Polaromonas sp. CT11-55 TaxID=3243045 RepID=UPI0039A4A952